MDQLDYKVALDLWRQAVETQIHFNEMSHKARQLGVSFAVTTLGICVGIYSTDSVGFSALTKGQVCGFLTLIASGGIFAVGFLELRHYQRLLRGAVLFGEKLENEGFSKLIPIHGAGMTAHISFAAKDRKELRSIYPRSRTSQWSIFGFYAGILVTMFVGGAFFFSLQEVSRPSNGPAQYVTAAWLLILLVGLYSVLPDPPETDPELVADSQISSNRHKKAA